MMELGCFSGLQFSCFGWRCVEELFSGFDSMSVGRTEDEHELRGVLDLESWMVEVMVDS